MSGQQEGPNDFASALRRLLESGAPEFGEVNAAFVDGLGNTNIAAFNPTTGMLDLHFNDVNWGNLKVRLSRNRLNIANIPDTYHRQAFVWDVLNDAVVTNVLRCNKAYKVSYPVNKSLAELVNYILTSTSYYGSYMGERYYIVYEKAFKLLNSRGVPEILLPPFERKALAAIRGLTAIGYLLEVSVVEALDLLGLRDLKDSIVSAIGELAPRAGDLLIGWDWRTDARLTLRDARDDPSALKAYLNLFDFFSGLVDENYARATLLPGPAAGLPLGVHADWDNVRSLYLMYKEDEAVRLLGDLASGDDLLSILEVNGVRVACRDDLKAMKDEGLRRAATAFYIASKNAYLLLYKLLRATLEAGWPPGLS